VAKRDETIGIEVRDSGPGLSDEQREHLFEGFYTTKDGGTGLGLAVSRELAVGMGCTLHSGITARSDIRDRASRTASMTKMRSATILIAEDERTARVSLAGLLQAEGFHVLEAEDAARALSLLLSEDPEVALIDIRMPAMDGLTVLRAREGGSDSALIVMTAHGDSGTAIDAMKLGAFD
jgi:CheY-like chemotaxis protein